MHRSFPVLLMAVLVPSWHSQNNGVSQGLLTFNTIMKIKNIKDKNQLVGGQYYIRLVVNHLGHHWIEIVRPLGRYHGKPGKEKIQIERYDTKFGYRPEFAKWESYLTDLGLKKEIKLYFMGVCYSGSKLFEFNTRNFQFLSNLTLDQALSVINNPHNRIRTLSFEQLRYCHDEHHHHNLDKKRLRHYESEKHFEKHF